MAESMLNGYITQNANESGSAMLKPIDAEKIVDQYLSSEESKTYITELTEKYQLPEDSFRRAYQSLLMGAVTGYVANELANGVAPPESTQPSAPTEPQKPTVAPVPSEPVDSDNQPSVNEPTQQPLTTTPIVPIELDQISAAITYEDVAQFVPKYIESSVVSAASKAMAAQMIRPEAQKLLQNLVSDFGNQFLSYLGNSFMIGIITYISVMELTKEIGVLRAIGASKHNISQVFNAETFIIGLCSGLIGVGTSLLLLFPCNQIIHNLIGNANITAQLPVMNAIILIILSMILTMLGGFIPSKKAAQKDPVIALRSE